MIFLFHAEVSGGVSDWSVSSAFPFGWQLCIRVCIPKVEGSAIFSILLDWYASHSTKDNSQAHVLHSV